MKINKWRSPFYKLPPDKWTGYGINSSMTEKERKEAIIKMGEWSMLLYMLQYTTKIWKLTKYIFFIALIALFVSLFSCQKDDVEQKPNCTPGYIVSNEICHNIFIDATFPQDHCGVKSIDLFVSKLHVARNVAVRVGGSLYTLRPRDENTIYVGAYAWNIIKEDCQHVE